MMKFRDSVDIYDLTAAQAVDVVVKEVMEVMGISKKDASVLVKNALVYNVVIDEIISQCMFLAGRDE